MARVLITRPEAQAETLAQSLRFRGYDVLIEPLLKIQPHVVARPSMPTLDALLITSANALTYLEKRRAEITNLLKVPCYCVGSKTATAALAFGFTHLFEGTSDSVELAKMIQKDFRPGSFLLHPCAAEMPSPVGRILQSLGYQFYPWPTYSTEEAQTLSNGLKEALTNKLLDAALFFSPRTAVVFAKCAEAEGVSACCQSLTAIGLSRAVTARLNALPWQSVLTAALPNEAALMECLFQTLPAL